MNSEIKKIKLYRTIVLMEDDLLDFINIHMTDAFDQKHIKQKLYKFLSSNYNLYPDINFEYDEDKTIIKINFYDTFVLQFEITQDIGIL